MARPSLSWRSRYRTYTGADERMDTFEGKHAFPPLSSSPIVANHPDVVSGVNSVEPRVQATQSRKLHGRPI